MTRPRKLGAKSSGVSWDEQTAKRIQDFYFKMGPVVAEQENRRLKISEIIRLATNVGFDVLERTALDENGHWLRNEGQIVLDGLKTTKLPKAEIRKAVLTIKLPLKKHMSRDERDLKRALEVREA